MDRTNRSRSKMSRRARKRRLQNRLYLLSIIAILAVSCVALTHQLHTDGNAADIPASEPAAMHSDSQGIDRTVWNLILVNTWHKLPDDFPVEVADVGDGHAIDRRAADALTAMLDAARAEGLSPLICSSYRSRETQTSLFDQKVDEYCALGYAQADAETEAAKWVAVPDTSEHQTGLAVDIVSTGYQMLDEGQENTAEQQWLMQNAHLYGFILRYPSDKSALTGIAYEPWHYRYVGLAAAKDIYEGGFCLEEYLA